MNRIEWDWAGPYGTVGGTACLTVGAYAAVSWGHAVGLPAWWALVAAAVLGWAELVVSAHRALPTPGRVYRVGCALGAGVWGCWALATSPWTLHAALALVVGAVAAGVLATVYAYTQPPDQPKAAAVQPQPAGRGLDREAREWELRLARIANIGKVTPEGVLVDGAEVRGIGKWPTGAGRTIDVDLPRGKTWRDHVLPFAAALASDLRLPAGCGVEIGRGVHQGACVIRVSEKDELGSDQPYPDDYRPMSINYPIPIGVHRDSTLAEIEMRQPSTMVIGQKGSGKTNQLQVIIGGLGRCTDCLVWCLDMGGGGVGLPWLWPWQDGTAARPVIDWVAADPDEARLMLEAGLRVARHRKVAYAQRKRAANTDLLPIDAEVPEIVIVVDEGAEVTSWRSKLGAISDLLTSIVQIARDSAVNVVYSGLRATGDTIGRDMSTQMGNRLALRMQDETEYGVTLGWSGKVSPEDIAHPGCGFLATIDRPAPRPYRAYRMLPAQIEALSAAVADLRPVLDEPSARVAGEAYATRWDRAAYLLDDDPATSTNTEDKPMSDGYTMPPARDPQELLREAAELDRAMREEIAQARGDVNDPDVDERFRQIVAGTVVPADPSTWPAPDVSASGRARLVELVDLAGPGGIMFGDLQERLAAEGYKPSRSTLYNWIALEKAAGSIVQPSGDKSPYVTPRFHRPEGGQPDG